MSLIMLRGNYTAPQWSAIKSDPDVAPERIRSYAAACDATLIRYFFSLDDFDFYAFVEADEESRLAALRHLLMSSGDFLALDGEMLLEPAQLLPLLSRAHRRLVRSSP